MAIHVEVGEFPDVLQNGFKVLPVGHIIVPALKEVGIVGVLAVADMGGGDNEIKFIVLGKYGIFSQYFRLQANLNAVEQADFILVFGFLILLTQLQSIISLPVQQMMEQVN